MPALNTISKMLKYLLDKSNDSNVCKRDIVDVLYPVGSIIYSSDTTFDPNTYYGHGSVWTKVEGKFLMGSSETYPIGSVGGEAEHKLTTAELPSHSHNTASNGQNVFTTDKSASEQGGTLTGTTKYYCACTGKNYSWVTKTGTAGSGTAHNNLPPYKTVNIWERTA